MRQLSASRGSFRGDYRLRVSVDGGTLSQDGKDLVWDGHGYYEVALDAGKLTWKR